MLSCLLVRAKGDFPSDINLDLCEYQCCSNTCDCTKYDTVVLQGYANSVSWIRPRGEGYEFVHTAEQRTNVPRLVTTSEHDIIRFMMSTHRYIILRTTVLQLKELQVLRLASYARF